MVPEQQVTRLLREWGGGSKEALDQLMPLVYHQLRKLAARCLAAEGPHHTLRATALVNEAYLRLVASDVSFNDRAHFFALAARLLRRILVDHARAQGRQKRGAGAERVTLEEAVLAGPLRPDLLNLDEASSGSPRSTNARAKWWNCSSSAVSPMRRPPPLSRFL